MKNIGLKSAFSFAFAALLLVGAASVAVPPAPDKAKPSPGTATEQEETFAKAILEATASQDYSAFMANGNAAFKTIREPQFKSLSTVLGPRLKAGYNMLCLGALEKQGHHMTLWKVTYDDGSDDGLLKLSVKNGKVGGALIE